MLIPRGDWIVVRRHVRRTDRGTVIKAGMSESDARYVAAFNNRVANEAMARAPANYNYWAMPRSDY